jgi:hypothetical protein
MFVVIGHRRPVTEKLLNTEYEPNPFNHPDASEGHIRPYIPKAPETIFRTGSGGRGEAENVCVCQCVQIHYLLTHMYHGCEK